MNPEPQPPELLRTFICLPLPAPIVDALRRIQRTLAEHLPSDGIRWSAPEQIHLTLRFLGQVAATEIPKLVASLTEVGRTVAPFRLDLGACGCFPESGLPRVLWIGIGGETARLLDLQRRVEQAVAGQGDHLESKPFAPHLTLARIRPGSRTARALARTLITEAPTTAGEWTVDTFYLMRSELGPDGARHTPLARIPFGAAPDAGRGE